MAKDEHITILFRKYLAGTYTSEELDALLRYFKQEEASGQLTELIERALAEPALDAAYAERVRAIQGRVAERFIVDRPRRLTRWLSYAAAILITAGVGAWLFFAADSSQQPTENTLAADVAPGGNRATLTLADGRTIGLSEAQAGIIVGEGISYLDGTQIVDSGQLAIDNGRQKGTINYPSSTINSLTTPKGGQYQVTLPDGTKVWLNAASTLKYPSRFEGDERIVELVGEGYFEVNRRKSNQSVSSAFQPFKVITNSQTVEVLGTEFNISAYADDPDTKTTLVEGAVQIVNRQSEAVNKLRPGEQAVVRNATTETHQVDVQQYIAWKKGRFAFQNADVKTVMKQLERWYDIDVVYQGNVSAGTFNGKIDRNLTLNQLLRGLAQTEINYTIHGRTLTIIGQE